MSRFLIIMFFPVLLLAQESNYVVNYDRFTIPDELSHNRVFQSFKDSRGMLWIIAGNGLNRFDGIHFKSIPLDTDIDAPNTKIFLEDKDGDIWIGGQGQPLLCFNIFTETARTAREKYGPQFPEQVICAIKGASETYYLQTSSNSLGVFSRDNGFEPVYNAPGNIITPVAALSGGTLWLRQERDSHDKVSEMIAFDAARRKIKVLRCPGHIYNYGLWGQDKVFYSTSDSFFVAGVQGVFIRKDMHALFLKSNHAVKPVPKSLQQITVDPETGDIWCTSPEEMHVLNKAFLLRYDLKKENALIQPAELHQLNIDSQHFAWLSTSDGLFKVRLLPNPFFRRTDNDMKGLQPATGLSQHVEAYYYATVDGLRHICQDADGSWWMATSKGLIHVDWQIGEYRLFTTRDGLSNNSCYAVVSDSYGFIWVSNEVGLMQFEKSSGKATTYYKTDGVDIDKFLPGVCFRGVDGTLTFGGAKWLLSFRSRDLLHTFEEHKDIRLMLTECRISSGEGRESEDVCADFYRENKITLLPNDRFMQMNVALTDYSFPGRIKYEYQIQGYNREWVKMRDNIISIAGLPYGSYKVVVRARGSDGAYTGQKLTIPLFIIRPFYQQPGFVLLLIILLAGTCKGYKTYRARGTEDALSDSIAAVEEPSFMLSGEEISVATLTPVDEAFLEDLHAIIIGHLSNTKFDAKMLCKIVGLSETQLHRRLKALTGLSTGRYMHSIRLEEAKKKIESTKLTIAEIAYQTGFSDPAYFTRLFTKKYQHPPSYFREDS